MKKQLLLGTALLVAVTAFSQKGRPGSTVAGHVNANVLKFNTFALDDAPTTYNNVKSKEIEKQVKADLNQTSIGSAKTMSATTIAWKLTNGSMNCYGQLVAHSRSLQYNPNVNAVSIIHRKSQFYASTPAPPSGTESGVIVAQISSNWGATFDSTCLWSGNANAGRYPHGAIYSAPGNTNIANAYVVGAGPTVAGTAFTGDWYASKQLNAFNTTADPAPNAQQFLSFSLPSYPANQCRHGWSRYGFSSTNDGAVRSLALVQNDQTTLGSAADMRGVALVKGTFAAGVFNWTTDTMIPNTVMAFGTEKVLSSDPQMAWSQDGQTGYVVMLGALANSTLATRGYQPIIYKTVNGGTSWTGPFNIDFNANNYNTYSVVTQHLAWEIKGNDTFPLPYFTDYDLAVDSAGKLHIGATICSGAIPHDDSLNYISQWSMSINPGKLYLWRHVAGNRPYLWDFIGDGTGPFDVKCIDSMWTEDPGSAPTSQGYNENPWDPTGTGNAKINIDSRIQMGRTPDGKYITFSWSESDTNFTQGNLKYNILPNIKARCLQARGNVSAYYISPQEYNVSRPAAGQGTVHPQVASRATLHYMSPVTGAAQYSLVGCGNSAHIDVPFTVTNSNPYSQLTNCATWYTTAHLGFNMCVLGTDENTIAKEKSLAEAILFPNPATESVHVRFNMNEVAKADVKVYNIVGSVVKEYNTSTELGVNEVIIDIKDLNTGVYFVNIKSGKNQITRKLIVE